MASNDGYKGWERSFAGGALLAGYGIVAVRVSHAGVLGPLMSAGLFAAGFDLAFSAELYDFVQREGHGYTTGSVASMFYHGNLAALGASQLYRLLAGPLPQTSIRWARGPWWLVLVLAVVAGALTWLGVEAACRDGRPGLYAAGAVIWIVGMPHALASMPVLCGLGFPKALGWWALVAIGNLVGAAGMRAALYH